VSDCVGSSEKLYKIEMNDECITLQCYKLGVTMTVNYVKNTMTIKVTVPYLHLRLCYFLILILFFS